MSWDQGLTQSEISSAVAMDASLEAHRNKLRLDSLAWNVQRLEKENSQLRAEIEALKAAREPAGAQEKAK